MLPAAPLASARAMRRRLATLAAAALAAGLLLALTAPAALADTVNSGEGFYGETDDKVVTYAGFMVIAFFPLLILALTLGQRALHRRKEASLATQRRRADAGEWRGGW